MTVSITLDKTGIDNTSDQALNTNLLALATSIEGVFNNMFNGVQAFDRLLFTAGEISQIENGAIDAPGFGILTIYPEVGATDYLDTIGVSNNRFVILKAAVGTTIYVTSGVGNTTTLDGTTLTMTGNVILMAWCIGSQWAVIGNGTGGAAVPNNFSAIVPPIGTDDTPDYAAGSLWGDLVDDAFYVNLDPTAGGAIWKLITDPKLRFDYVGRSGTIYGIGVANPTIANTPSFLIDATGVYTSLPTTNVSGNLGGFISTTFTILRPDHDATVEFLIKTEASLVTQRIWAGVVDADITNVDTLAAGRKFVGWRYSTVAGDTGWRPILHDGTTQDTGTAIGTVVADTQYKLKFRIDSANSRVFFSVNDGVETILTTNFPAATTSLGVVCRIITQSAAIRTLYVTHCKVLAT